MTIASDNEPEKAHVEAPEIPPWVDHIDGKWVEYKHGGVKSRDAGWLIRLVGDNPDPPFGRPGRIVIIGHGPDLMSAIRDAVEREVEETS